MRIIRISDLSRYLRYRSGWNTQQLPRGLHPDFRSVVHKFFSRFLFKCSAEMRRGKAKKPAEFLLAYGRILHKICPYRFQQAVLPAICNCFIKYLQVFFKTVLFKNIPRNLLVHLVRNLGCRA